MTPNSTEERIASWLNAFKADPFSTGKDKAARLLEYVAALTRTDNDVSGLVEALEPSGDTKAAYHGEFTFDLYEGVSDAGIDQYRKVYVPWDTVKEIMAAIRDRAALAKHRRSNGDSA